MPRGRKRNDLGLNVPADRVMIPKPKYHVGDIVRLTKPDGEGNPRHRHLFDVRYSFNEEKYEYHTFDDMIQAEEIHSKVGYDDLPEEE